MKNFWVGFFVPVLILCGVLIVNQFYPFLNLATNQVVNDPVSTSEYTITVTTNPGTFIDYVDHDIITASEYAIESDGVNRQFCQLSIYNSETEEQLQNNSEINLGDELQINLAVPEGYRLNAFYVDGYIANNSYLLTVAGNVSIYIDVEQIIALPDPVSEYKLTITTNAGTVVDYVDYDVISADEYAIETVGFNRQFVQLSIYNTETEEQLQNNSAIEIGDELNIHIAVPEGYKLNAFYVGGYYATNDYVYTVTGNTSIYVDIERISSLFYGYMDGDCGVVNLSIDSSGTITNYEYDITLGVPGYLIGTLLYGDIVTITGVPTVSGIITCFEVRTYSNADRADADVYDLIFDYNSLGTGSDELVDNGFSFTVFEAYMFDFYIEIESI